MFGAWVTVYHTSPPVGPSRAPSAFCPYSHLLARGSVCQAESKPPAVGRDLHRNCDLPSEVAPWSDFSPITDEDLVRLGFEPQLIDIPFVVSTAQRVERSSSGKSQLTLTEAERLIEMLDVVRPHP